MILLIGIILVSSATYKLGLIGTFNGDAYGFLLPSIIKSFPFNLYFLKSSLLVKNNPNIFPTSFPFNLFNAPMYLGSTLNFLGYAIINKSLTGIALTILVGIVYFCGNIFEE